MWYAVAYGARRKMEMGPVAPMMGMVEMTMDLLADKETDQMVHLAGLLGLRTQTEMATGRGLTH